MQEELRLVTKDSISVFSEWTLLHGIDRLTVVSKNKRHFFPLEDVTYYTIGDKYYEPSKLRMSGKGAIYMWCDELNERGV